MTKSLQLLKMLSTILERADRLIDRIKHHFCS